MGAEYQIERTAPTVYIDKAGKPVRGYTVSVYLVEFDEYHELQVPDLTEKTVKAACDKLVADRKKLATL